MKKLITVALLIIVNSFISLRSAAAGENPEANENFLTSVAQKNLEGIIAALGRRADVNKRNDFGAHAVYFSVKNGGYYYPKDIALKSKIITALLDNGADINAQSCRGTTALIEASHNGINNIVSLLLARGADIEIKDDSGKTAINWAFISNHLDTVAILEKEKARRRALRIAEANSALNAGMHASATNDPKDLINIVNKYMD